MQERRQVRSAPVMPDRPDEQYLPWDEPTREQPAAQRRAAGAHRRWQPVPLATRVWRSGSHALLLATGLVLVARFAVFWFGPGRLPDDLGGRLWPVNVLLFAAVTTTYMVVAIQLEERDLIEAFGDEYRRYRKRVSMLVPWRKSPAE